MYTLGINAAYHDSAACIVRDGEVVAAAEEERFTHVKHGKRPTPFEAYALPFHAIDYCLSAAGIEMADVAHVGYSYNPYLLLNGHTGSPSIELPLEPSAHAVPAEWEAAWDPLFVCSVVNAPRQLAGGAPHHLRRRFGRLNHDGPFRWHFVDHHLAHAASAFFACPFESAAVLTLDGRGERATTSYWTGEGLRMDKIKEVRMPHSLGLLYEEITSYLGFLHSSDEYKVMALASYGKPVYLDVFRSIIREDGEGGYEIAPHDWEKLFGPARAKDAPYERRHFDVAHSLQKALEETVLRLARWLGEATGRENLCLAGGVALNCVMNARLRDEGPFQRVWVQPAAGDAGTALGAALWIDAVRRRVRGGGGDARWVMDHAYLGPEYGEREIEEFLRWSKVPYRRLSDTAAGTAELLENERIVGWFQGRMEFGPRALGARSILASPRSAAMQDRLNEIKDREDFRPVAPAVLEEEAARWFETEGPSPFMLFVNGVRPEKAGLIPAVRHVDGTARIQTVNRAQNPLYYDTIREFGRRTGVPVVVNTSFNTRGKPIVCAPRDAVECFSTSPLDALVMGPFVLEKGR